MKLKDILHFISAYDEICVQDCEGNIFNGFCSDFYATYEKAFELAELPVDRIRAYKGVVILLLGHEN
jgi:hypothetical protein